MSELAPRDETVGQVEQRTPQQQLAAFVRSDKFQSQVALVLPPTVPPARFARSFGTLLLQNPDIVNADFDSIVASLLKCAQDGLLPDGREAAIATYKGKAQYLPMVGGYRKIAGEYGWQITARVVYHADEFEVEQGLHPKLRHVPARPGGDRGPRVAAYAIGRHRDGRVAPPVVMYAEEIAQRQAVAQTDKVWKQWTDRMWEKTVAKALFKELPLDQLDERVLRLTAASEQEPAAAADAIYGPGAGAGLRVDAATGEILAPSGASDAGATLSVAASTSETGGGLPFSPAAGLPTTPEPDLDPEPEPPASAIRVPEAAINAAAETLFTVGITEDNPAGRQVTLAKILESPAADRWVKWALEGGVPEGADRAALELVVQHRAPELWAAHVGEAA